MIVGLAGIGLAVVMYGVATGIPAMLAKRFGAIYRFLLNKWYFDELYDAIFVRPAFKLGRGFWKDGDGAVIDGLGVDNVAAKALLAAKSMVRLQTGYVFHYAFAMLIGVLILTSWYLLRFMG